MTRRRQEAETTGGGAMFTEVAVRFPSAAGAADAVELAGTFAAPSGRSNPPVAVLVSGTGPIDRDVTFVGHALFRVLAHSLAQAGIASLRFDKRGVGESQGDFSTAGPDDFVADVLGAVEYLVHEQEFAGGRVGLVGHSEGGIVALTAAAKMDMTPFCVLLASPLLSGRDNLVQSFALLARGSLDRDDTFDSYVSELTTLLAFARSADTAAPQPGTARRPDAAPHPDAAARQETVAQPAGIARPEAVALANNLAPLIINERTQVILGGGTMSGEEFLDLLSSPCLETCLSWDPSRVVPLVTCPVLVIHGGKDTQAPAVQNGAAARGLVERLGKQNWVVREMGEMNHAFQRCATGMPDEYARIDHVMADEVVGEIAAWIKSMTKR